VRDDPIERGWDSFSDVSDQFVYVMITRALKLDLGAELVSTQ